MSLKTTRSLRFALFLSADNQIARWYQHVLRLSFIFTVTAKFKSWSALRVRVTFCVSILYIVVRLCYTSMLKLLKLSRSPEGKPGIDTAGEATGSNGPADRSGSTRVTGLQYSVQT